MIRAIALAALATTGCATVWATSQVAGEAKLWDEGVREQSVPLPGIQEHLVVTLPLAIEYQSIPSTTTNAGPTRGPALPFALGCRVAQQGNEAVYHSAFRYGSTWKKGTAVFFLVEALVASGVLLLADHSAGNLATGGYAALDALGTAALFFAPREEIYRRDEQPTTTPIRSDCPDGLVLEVGGNPLPIDAAGHLGEAGDAALDAWMAMPRGQLRVGFAGGQVAALPIDLAEQCAWLRAHRPAAPTACRGVLTAQPRETTATIAVTAGTFTQIAQP